MKKLHISDKSLYTDNISLLLLEYCTVFLILYDYFHSIIYFYEIKQKKKITFMRAIIV